MFKKILLPTDGSELSRKAVKKGVTFAKSMGAGVIGSFSPADSPNLLYSYFIPLSLMSQGEFDANATKAAERHLAFVEKTREGRRRAVQGLLRRECRNLRLNNRLTRHDAVIPNRCARHRGPSTPRVRRMIERPSPLSRRLCPGRKTFP